MHKILFSLLFVLTLSFFLRSAVFADAPTPTPCPVDQTCTDLGPIPNDPAAFVQKFYGIGLGLIGGVAVLFIIFGGYLVMTSTGDPGQLAKGRSYIIYAIVGLLLAIFGFVFMQLVGANILHIPGFG